MNYKYVYLLFLGIAVLLSGCHKMGGGAINMPSGGVAIPSMVMPVTFENNNISEPFQAYSLQCLQNSREPKLDYSLARSPLFNISIYDADKKCFWREYVVRNEDFNTAEIDCQYSTCYTFDVYPDPVKLVFYVSGLNMSFVSNEVKFDYNEHINMNLKSVRDKQYRINLKSDGTAEIIETANK